MEIMIKDSGNLPSGVTVLADADRNFPGSPRSTKQVREKRFGVGEVITLAPGAPLAINAEWSVTGGFVGAPITKDLAVKGKATFRCPGTPLGQTSYTIRLSLKTAANANPMAIVVFDVIAPSVSKQVWVKNHHFECDPAKVKPAGCTHWNEDPNGGFLVKWYFGPEDVYFGGIEHRECGGNNTWKLSGICENYPALKNKKHSDGGSSEAWGLDSPAQWDINGTLAGTDKVYSFLIVAELKDQLGGTLPDPFILDTANADYNKVIGEASLLIPNHYRIKGSADINGRQFTENVHGFRVTKGGKLTVYKYPPGKPALGNEKTFERTDAQVIGW